MGMFFLSWTWSGEDASCYLLLHALFVLAASGCAVNCEMCRAGQARLRLQGAVARQSASRGTRDCQCQPPDAGGGMPEPRCRRLAGTQFTPDCQPPHATPLASLSRWPCLLSASWGVEALRGKNTWADFWATAHPLHARGAGVGDGDGGRRRRCGLPAGVRSSRTCSWLFLLKHFSVQMSSKRIFYL